MNTYHYLISYYYETGKIFKKKGIGRVFYKAFDVIENFQSIKKVEQNIKKSFGTNNVECAVLSYQLVTVDDTLNLNRESNNDVVGNLLF